MLYTADPFSVCKPDMNRLEREDLKQIIINLQRFVDLYIKTTIKIASYLLEEKSRECCLLVAIDDS